MYSIEHDDLRNIEVQVPSLPSTLSRTLAFYWVQMCSWWRRPRYSKIKAARHQPEDQPEDQPDEVASSPDGQKNKGFHNLAIWPHAGPCDCFCFYSCMFSFMSEFQKDLPCVLLLMCEGFISRCRYYLVKRDIHLKEFRESPLLKLSSFATLSLSVGNLPTYGA